MQRTPAFAVAGLRPTQSKNEKKRMGQNLATHGREAANVRKAGAAFGWPFTDPPEGTNSALPPPCLNMPQRGRKRVCVRKREREKATAVALKTQYIDA